MFQSDVSCWEHLCGSWCMCLWNCDLKWIFGFFGFFGFFGLFGVVGGSGSVGVMELA